MTTPQLRPFTVVIDMVHQLANQYPNQKAYGQYFDGAQQPICIYGNVMAQLGVYGDGGEYVIAADSQHVVTEGDRVVNISWERLGIHTPDAEQQLWAAQVQLNQDGTWEGDPDLDGRISWGEAVHRADIQFPNVRGSNTRSHG